MALQDEMFYGSGTDFLTERSDLLEDLYPSTDKFESLEDVGLLILEAFAIFHIFVLWDLRDCLLLGGNLDDLQKIADRWARHRVKMLYDESKESNFKMWKMVPKSKLGMHDFLTYLCSKKATPGNVSLPDEIRKYLLKFFMQMHRDIQTQIILPIYQMHDVINVAPSNWKTVDTLDMLVRLRTKLWNILTREMKIF